jgi:hypothetical protein
MQQELWVECRSCGWNAAGVVSGIQPQLWVECSRNCGWNAGAVSGMQELWVECSRSCELSATRAVDGMQQLRLQLEVLSCLVRCLTVTGVHHLTDPLGEVDCFVVDGLRLFDKHVVN